MIGLAVLIRSRLDARENDAAVTAERPTGTLVCSTELRRVCDQLKAANETLQVRVEDAGTTYATLTAATFQRDAAKIDAWLVPQPWPAMVDEARQRGSLEPALVETSRTLARSPAVIVIWRDRRDALAKSCPGGTVDWRCIGNAAGKPWTDVGGQVSWGSVKPGHPPPDKSATGLFVFGQATGQYLGRADFARNDLDDADYRVWANGLEQAIPTFTPSAGSAFDQMLFSGRSSFDVAGALEASAGPAVRASRDKDALSIEYPAAGVTADVVVVPVRGSDSGGRVRALLESTGSGEILARDGWRVDGQPSPEGVRTDLALPDGNGLPRAGVLQALRDVWAEVR